MAAAAHALPFVDSKWRQREMSPVKKSVANIIEIPAPALLPPLPPCPPTPPPVKDRFIIKMWASQPVHTAHSVQNITLTAIFSHL